LLLIGGFQLRQLVYFHDFEINLIAVGLFELSKNVKYSVLLLYPHVEDRSVATFKAFKLLAGDRLPASLPNALGTFNSEIFVLQRPHQNCNHARVFLQ
jgi:hypothetical protein